MINTEWGDILNDIQVDGEDSKLVTSKRDISQYLNMELVEKNRFKPDMSLLTQYPCIEEFIIKNIQLNTQLKEELINTEKNKRDATELEDYRGFPRGFFQKLGVFYSSDISSIVVNFPYMRHTDLFQITNDSYTDRYMLPIDLPNGQVMTHMGYAVPQNGFVAEKKYMMANIDWIDQGNIIGNLGSFKRHPDTNIVYAAEGMMDAYRLEDVYETPAIALLGSSLTDNKKAILQMIKSEGYAIIYVPDMDDAGKNEWLLSSNLFDNIMRIPESSDFKDFDKMVLTYYIDYILANHNELNTDLEPEKIPVATIPHQKLKELNEEVKKLVKYDSPLSTITPTVKNDFHMKIRGFSINFNYDF